MDKRVEKILFNLKQIEAGIARAAKWIDKNYAGKKPILIGVLKGVVPFFSYLMVKIKTDITIDFIVCTSYHGNVTQVSKPNVVMDLKADIKNKDVIVIEDIIDTGRSLYSIVNLLKKKKPKSIKVITLLDKYQARKVPFNPDFSCFKVPNKYIVGFGFDVDEQLRNLPYIGVYKQSLYDKKIKSLKGAQNAKQKNK